MYDAAALLHIWLYNITLWEILQLIENKSLYYFSKLWGFTSLVLKYFLANNCDSLLNTR